MTQKSPDKPAKQVMFSEQPAHQVTFDEPADREKQELLELRSEVIDEQTQLNALRRKKTSFVDDKYGQIEKQREALN
jgi:hypothetical protein